MEEKVVFSENDAVLIEKIEDYREKTGLDFSEAVKELCLKALNGLKLEWEEY